MSIIAVSINVTANGGRGAHRGGDDALRPAADPLSDLGHHGSVLNGACFKKLNVFSFEGNRNN